MATRITQLAKVILDNATLIDKHLQYKGAQIPSFDIDAPKKIDTTGPAEAARNTAISAANELSDLLKGPAEMLRPDWSELVCLRIISRLGIAKMVPVGVAVPFSDIAAKTKLPERDVRRILRCAMTRHIFYEPRSGYVTHTALSQLLAEDSKQQDIVASVVDVFWPAAVRTADAVEKWPGSEEPEQTGLSMALNPGKTMWQTFAENEEMGRRFGVFIGGTGGNDIGGAAAGDVLLEMVKWKGKVVDIGGSHGDVMVNVLRRCPEVTEAVIEDLPETVQKGRERAPADLDGRLRFQGHDFFKPQPETADIFFFRWVFHNWSNKYSVQILRNLVPAMAADTTIVINDFILPEPNTLPPGLERYVRAVDVTMLATLNALERDTEGWRELVKEADERFYIKDIRVAPPGIMGIIEVGWNDRTA